MLGRFGKTIFTIFMLLASAAFAFAQVSAPPSVRLPGVNDQPVAKGLEILNQANLAHGGKALDDLKTLKITERFRVDNLFYEVKTLIDFERKKVREESRGANDYLYVKQADADAGWVFAANERREMETEERADLNALARAGLLGLRRDALENITITSVQIDSLTKLKTLRVSSGGKDFVWVFDSQNRLLSESSSGYNGEKQEFFADFRAIGAINMPHRSAGSLTSRFSPQPLILTRELLIVETNSIFTEKDWSLPN